MSYEVTHGSYRWYADELTESVESIVMDLSDYADDDYGDAIYQAAGDAVIYTVTAMAILANSDNEDAVFDHMGSDAFSGCSSMSEVFTRAACYAYAQDLAEALNGLGDDEKLTLRGEALCEDCGEAFQEAELDDEREGREGDLLCDGCYSDWEIDQEDEDEDEEDEGEE
jgi:hypothetical protein